MEIFIHDDMIQSWRKSVAARVSAPLTLLSSALRGLGEFSNSVKSVSGNTVNNTINETRLDTMNVTKDSANA